MKIKEVREMDAKTLAETKENLQEKLAQMKLNHTVTPLENPSQIKAVRRDIARLNTEIRQRELNNNNGPDGNKKFKKNKTGCRY